MAGLGLLVSIFGIGNAIAGLCTGHYSLVTSGLIISTNGNVMMLAWHVLNLKKKMSA